MAAEEAALEAMIMVGDDGYDGDGNEATSGDMQ